MTRLTPQQKKQISYDRDRRNDEGENDKASRKLIPRAKSRASRAYRRVTSQKLPRNVPMLDHDSAAQAQADIRSVRRSQWRKTPDIALGEFVRRQSVRRARAAKPRSER
jgi:hypothetical protein